MVLLELWADRKPPSLILCFLLLLCFIVLQSCNETEISMDEPPLDKIEFGFFNPITTEYDCQLKRTQSTSETPKNASKYTVLFIGFPQAKFDKGYAYLENESFRIAMRVHNQLFERLDTSYHSIEVGFHTNSQQHKSFTFQLNE